MADDGNGTYDLFLRDRSTETTERVSVGNTGAEANGRSQGGAMSADGRTLAFGSSASNLVASDTNSREDVFVRNR